MIVKSSLRLLFALALMFPLLIFGNGKYHVALGITNSEGLFSMGHAWEKDQVAFGLQQVHSVGESYAFLPFAGYQRSLLAGHSPYLSMAYNAVLATDGEGIYAIDGLEVKPGWNPGHLSANAGYRLRFARADLKAEIGARTPVNSRFARGWHLDYGAGVSLPFPLW